MRKAQPITQQVKQPVQQPIPQPVQQPIPQPVQQPIPQPVQQPIPQYYQQPVVGQYYPQQQQRTGVYITFSKDNVEKEHSGISKSGQPYSSILLKVSDQVSIWIDTRVAFTSVYTNTVDAIIQPAFEYKNANKQYDAIMPKILGQTVIDMFNTNI